MLRELIMCDWTSIRPTATSFSFYSSSKYIFIKGWITFCNLDNKGNILDVFNIARIKSSAKQQNKVTWSLPPVGSFVFVTPDNFHSTPLPPTDRSFLIKCELSSMEKKNFNAWAIIISLIHSRSEARGKSCLISIVEGMSDVQAMFTTEIDTNQIHLALLEMMRLRVGRCIKSYNLINSSEGAGEILELIPS